MSWIRTLEWTIRKGFWNFVAKQKYRRNNPKPVDRVTHTSPSLRLIPLAEVYPDIPITDILIADRPPPDEMYTVGGLLARFLAWLSPKSSAEERVLRVLARLYPTRLSPMQPDRPGILPDPYAALDQAYTTGHRQTVRKKAAALNLDPKQMLHTPTRPLELGTFPDLGALALRGPYAGYVKKVHGTERQYEWDLRELSSYEAQPDLYEPWARVLFEFNERETSLVPCRIDCELGTILPSDPTWMLASRIAICAATTHTALVRHWTWTHMVGGECVAFATRTQLTESHPLCRLLWPHIVGTHASNRLAILGQLVPAGDFEAVYSLTYKSLCLLISKSASTFDLSLFDPSIDGQRRGVLGTMPTPTLDNCSRLFRIFQVHAERYLRLYYTDETLRYDEQIQNWMSELDRWLPNGLGLPAAALDCRRLSTVIAKLTYLESVHHEQMGTQLWNYQAWADTHPVRVYRDGRRLPEDVYQRMINSNYILNVVRTPLMTNLTHLVLQDERAAEATHLVRAFSEELAALQQSMDRDPWAPWKLYPIDLEANINA